MRGLVARAEREGQPGVRAPPAACGREVRDPGVGGEVHGGPRASDRERVPLPDDGESERGDPEQTRGEEDRDRVPALLQHPQERVPAVWRQLRGDPPLAAPRRTPGQRGTSPYEGGG